MSISLKVLQTQDVAISQSPASIGARLLALIIDFTIIGVYVFFTNKIPVEHINITFSVLLFSPPVLYPLVCEIMMNGQTVGKRLMHISVVTLEGGGPKITSFFIRWLMLPFDLLLASGLGELCVLFDERHRRLGDLVAGTWVVRTQTFRTETFSLSDYTPSPSYSPTYANARNLTPRQATTIAETIVNYDSKEVAEAAHRLALKVEDVVGEPLARRTEVSQKQERDVLSFLKRVLIDYRLCNS